MPLEVIVIHENSETEEVKEKYSISCTHFAVDCWSWNQNGYNSAKQWCSSWDGGTLVGTGENNCLKNDLSSDLGVFCYLLAK